MGEKGWLKLFTADARPGAYLRVVRPGSIQAGDPIEVVHRPDHDVTVSLFFRALMIDRELLPRLLAAGDDLDAEVRARGRAVPGQGGPRGGIASGPRRVVAGMTVAQHSGTLEIIDLGPVYRLGFGAMRITGPGIWGEPKDREEARRVVRRAVELGVNFIDTADSYGPDVSEQILAEALHPYPEGLKIGTKAGFERSGPNRWHTNGRPEYLRRRAEESLQKLRVERLDLLQLHRIDSKVPAAEQFGVLADLQREGKVGALGLSEVSVDDIEDASAYFTVATVQNRYNLTDTRSTDVLDYCEQQGIAFLPWAPISAGELAAPGGPVATVAERLGATPSQVALAWLLRRSPGDGADPRAPGRWPTWRRTWRPPSSSSTTTRTPRSARPPAPDARSAPKPTRWIDVHGRRGVRCNAAQCDRKQPRDVGSGEWRGRRVRGERL